jgi:ankyrin repeat protein
MAAPGAVAAIHRAAEDGDVEGVARLLDEDPRLLSSERDFQTLLTKAASRLRVGVVRLLLEKGVEVSTPDAIGNTALHHAASRGYEEMASLLLASGADTSRADGAAWTALMYASANGHRAVVRLLLRFMGGGGLDVMTDEDCTALWLACCDGHDDVVQALLLAGADHTIPATNGETPRQVAQSNHHHRCAAVIEVRGPRSLMPLPIH